MARLDNPEYSHSSKYRPVMDFRHVPVTAPTIRMPIGIGGMNPSKLQLQKITSIEDFCEHFSEMETIIEEMPAQGLSDLLPDLLAVIFGYGGHPGWRLKYSDRKTCLSQHYDKIIFFMSMNGKLFRLIDRLLAETNVKFHFPVDCLPERARVNLNNGVISHFYQEKLSVSSSGQIPSQLDLNALEYYLFLFAYYVVRPSSNKDKNQWSRYGDNLYHAIFEVYLNYFLPTDGSEISTQATLNIKEAGKENMHSRSGLGYGNYNKHMYIPELSVFRPGGNILSSSLSTDSLRRDTWKSEAFIQILTEFWLSNHSTGSPITFNKISREYNLPSEDHVRTVRMLVKHTHAFVNSAKTALPSINQFHGGCDSHTEELKQFIIPSFLQKELYEFLKYTFAHWPLDPSFKMVLETWLSFIQPWRYTSGSYHDSAESSITDLTSWKVFISQHILFYSSFLRVFVPRALRFDLRSTGDVHQLYRVLKVFSQANLVEILEDVDQQLCNTDCASTVHSLGSNRQSSLSYLGLQKATQHSELDEPRHVYESLFADQMVAQCKELATKLSETVTRLRSEDMRKRRDKNRKGNEGLFRRVKSFILGDQEQEEVHEEKLMEYLERSYGTLVDVFKLPLPAVIPEPLFVEDGETSNGLPRPRLYSDLSDNSQSMPDCHVADGGIVLTPKGRLQLINGVRHFDIRYQGDVELQPIRSYEVPCMVRTLFTLSTTVNEKYENELRRLYNRKDLLGIMLRNLAFRSQRPTWETQQTSSELQPRVSFRFMASHYTLGYFIWIILLLRLLGFGSFGIIFLSMLLLCFAFGRNVRLAEIRPKLD